MKKLQLSTIILGILIVCVSCTTNKRSIRVRPTQGEIANHGQYQPYLYFAQIINNAELWSYFCSKHYEHIPNRETSPIREVCRCEFLDSLWMDIALDSEVRGEGGLSISASIQCIFLYDSSFISNYILPLFEEESEKEEIEYTLVNANDSTFNHMVDFEHKIIINENAHYYPLKCEKVVRVYMSHGLKWLKAIVPQEKLIYCRDCFRDKPDDICLVIPLLERTVE